MTLRLDPADESVLADLADTQGISKHEAVVRAIREAGTRGLHEGRVRELSSAARERYADVLRRLGE